MMDALVLWIGERLLAGSLQVVALVALVWLTCRVVRVIPAATQAALWWLVALKLVLVFAPVPLIPVPVLPATFDPQAEPVQTRVFATADSVQMSPRNTLLQGLILIWIAVLLAHAGRLVLAHRQLRGVVRRSVEWTDADIGGLASRLGLKRTPAVRLSDEIGSPQVFGLWSPIVLMPAKTLNAFSDNERAMTLCHELMHVRRRDLAFGWVPACAERLFFFHPLARVAAREYLTAREAACDAAAVRALGVEAGDYGRMLIRLGIGDVRPVMAAGGSPFSASSLKRRLHMLEHQPVKTSRRWLWSVPLIGAAVIPIQLVARTPEAPQVTPSVTVKGTVTATTPFDGKSLELENAELQFGANGEIFQIEAEKLKSEKLKAKIEGELEKDTEVVFKVAKLVEQTEQARGIQEKAERARVEEMMALIARVQEENARANADKQRVIEDLAKELEQRQARERDVTRAQEAARQVERQAREVARAPQVTQQQRLERLLEQLERLAAEQRRLLEEVRRLQQQPRE